MFLLHIPAILYWPLIYRHAQIPCVFHPFVGACFLVSRLWRVHCKDKLCSSLVSQTVGGWLVGWWGLKQGPSVMPGVTGGMHAATWAYLTILCDDFGCILDIQTMVKELAMSFLPGSLLAMKHTYCHRCLLNLIVYSIIMFKPADDSDFHLSWESLL